MPILNALAAALAWLGRQGTRVLAVSIFFGLAVPSLAVFVKPYLGITVFVLLLFSFLRTDPVALRGHVRSPALVVITALWTMIVVPALFGTAYAFSGLREWMPPLYTIMVLHIAIAPITSVAAFAALIELDTAFSLAGLILGNAISPFTAAVFSYLFLGTSMFSPLDLGGKLLALYLASGIAAFIVRRLAGDERIERRREHIDGLNVIAMFVFAVAAMGSVTHYVLAEPLLAAEIMAIITLVALLLAGTSALVFARAGADRALVVGLLASLRNIGLVMATLGGTLPPLAWLYFGLAQFPIYLFPQLLKPFVRHRLARRQGGARPRR